MSHDAAALNGSVGLRLATPDRAPLGPANDTDIYVVEGHDWPLVEPGEYLAWIIGHEIRPYYDGYRLYLHLELLSGPYHDGQPDWRRDCGDYIPREGFDHPESGHLFAPYRIEKKNGRIKLRRRGKLYGDWCRAIPKVDRPKQFSPRQLVELVLRVAVKTSERDHKRHPHAEDRRYSLIEALLGPVIE